MRSTLGKDDSAVSPVIGVILLVAITVVTASIVFVMARNFGGQQDHLPNIQFLRDDLNGQLTVVKADNGIDRTDFQVRVNVNAHFGYNEEATGATTSLPAGSWVPLAPTAGTDIHGGDLINFCSSSGSADVSVMVRSVNPSGLLYTYTFTDLQPC